MEKHKFPNVRNQVSVIQGPRGFQGHSQIAPNRQSPTYPSQPLHPSQLQPPMAHQNKGSLPMTPFNNRRSVIPSTFHGIPLDLSRNSQGCPLIQQSIPAEMSSENCRWCMKKKCIYAPEDTPPTETVTMEELERVKNELEECSKRLLEKEMKVKDLTILADGQGQEMGQIHAQLKWHKRECEKLGGTVTKLLGVIVRLNDVVAQKNRATVDYRRTVEQYRELCVSLKERNDLLEGKLRETGEFMRNLNGQLKGKLDSLTGKYCKCSGKDLEENKAKREEKAAANNAEVEAAEAQSVIEVVDLEKEEFPETTPALVESTEVGLGECSKRIEQQEGESMELEMVPVVPPSSNIILDGAVGGSKSGEFPAHDSQSGNGEWSIVTPAAGEQQKNELDNGNFGEFSMGLETPNHILYVVHEEIIETSVDESGSQDNEIVLEGPIEDIEGGDHDDDQGGEKRKPEYDSGEVTTVCELFGMSNDENLGEHITLHYTESDDEAEDKDVVMDEVVVTEVIINQPEDVMMDDMSPILSTEYFEDDGACSKIFCERCYTPFPNQMKMDEHYKLEKFCWVGGDKQRVGNLDGKGDMMESENDDSDLDHYEDEDELLDV